MTGLMSLFSAIRLRWRGILIICLFLGIVLLVWQWRSDIQKTQKLRSENTQLVSAVEKQKQELEKLVKESERKERINKKYKAHIEELKSKIRKIPYDIEDKIKSNKTVSDWANRDMPDVVYDSLRTTGEESGSSRSQPNSTPKTMGGRNSTSSVEGKEQ